MDHIQIDNCISICIKIDNYQTDCDKSQNAKKCTWYWIKFDLQFAAMPTSTGRSEPRASPTFSLRVCRSQNFPCTAPPLLESWCWLRSTNSVSHCSQRMPGLPPKWKWSLQRETSTPFPSTAGSLALRCSCSEREQVCETDAWILHYHERWEGRQD